MEAYFEWPFRKLKLLLPSVDCATLASCTTPLRPARTRLEIRLGQNRSYKRWKNY